MTIGANRKLKLCDPFCHRKPAIDPDAKKDKPFKLKNDERIPRSLRIVMEASKLVKEIEEKKKIRVQSYQENHQKNLEGAGAKVEKKERKKLNKKQQKTEKKNQKVADSVAGKDVAVLPEKKKTVEQMTDYSSQQQQLSKILGYLPNPVDNPRIEGETEEDDLPKIDTIRHKGENDFQYQDRMRKEMNERTKKATNRFKKNKENAELKKLKKQLKKKGLKMVDIPKSKFNNNQQDSDDEEQEQVNNNNNKQDNNNKDNNNNEKKNPIVKKPQDKHKNSRKEFSELQDDIKFGEQADRPPQLIAVKDLSKHKSLPSTKSSKRKYLWQDGEEQQDGDDEQQQSKEDQERLERQQQDIKKQKLELLRTQVMANYKKAKSNKQQREAIKDAANAVTTTPSGARPNKDTKPKQFYL